jgi:hypothetical protein
MGSRSEPQEETMQASRCPTPRGLAAGVWIALALLGPGCSGTGFDDPRAGLSCVDDSQECVDRRQTTLNAMLADQDRKWVKEPAGPQAHASGVRLFAFRSRKKELSCEELAAGRREADGVPKSLRGEGGKGLSPAQISRTNMLATEVGRELAAEMRARKCKARG